LLLNRANKVLGVMNVSDGGISCTAVDTRLIMQSVILSNATQIIIAHNHPSGNLQPSAEDTYITKRVKKACEILNVELLDHLIITSENYYSFGDNGKL
jgi:DNA repair protein RadC